MNFIQFLILFPFVAAVVLAFVSHNGARRVVVIISSALIIAAAAAIAVPVLVTGQAVTLFEHTHTLDMIMLGVEVFLMCLIVFLSFKYKKYYAAVLSVAQTVLMAWFELSGRGASEQNHIYIDRLSSIMILIVAVVGCLICIYAVGYMNDYHHHHTEYKDRRKFFFAMLFVFLGAMFGLVTSSNMIWLYFFWEITSVASFLLIGYTRTGEAVNNSFRALWMNLLGGLGFAVAIVWLGGLFGIATLQDLILIGCSEYGILMVFPIFLLAFAGLTKSAQMPFSKWLLGAMVAPTPTSALLHSATMVKAGVYLLLRLAPAMQGTTAGLMVSLIGGFTFFITSLFAITQSDGKKVLAYSTISNLGLITACAGIGTSETIWAGILLMIFHAVSKSMLFQSVGAVENATGSRDIEDMHGLIVRLPKLALVMVLGIIGMYLAPFGMLVSKWAALKAFVDSGNFILVCLVAFGSATTLFYWTKWLGKIISVSSQSRRHENTTPGTAWFSLAIHAVLMVALCFVFPLISSKVLLPYLADIFGPNAIAAISQSNLVIMIIMIVLMVVIPAIGYAISKSAKEERSMVYMGGINEGDDREFTDSFGGKKTMYLTNWYMTDLFGEHKLWKPSIYIATAIIVVTIAITMGGAF